MVSKDEAKTKYAIKAINDMDSIFAVNSYIVGEDREDVLDAARVQIEFIEKQSPSSPPSPQSSPSGGEEGIKKQGEEPGPITKRTSEFKGSGIEGTKSHSPSASLSPLPSEGEGRVRGGSGDDSNVGETPNETLSISDIAPAIDAENEKKMIAADLKAIEDASKADKGEAPKKPKDHITGDDVLQKLRAEGREI